MNSPLGLYNENQMEPRCQDSPAGIVPYLGLVKRLAAHFRGRLPASIDHNDLMQAGVIGLMEAHRTYEGAKGDFETFAKIRVRGAMLDEIRRSGWATRSSVRTIQRARQVERELAASQGRAPTSTQIAAHMGLPLEEYLGMIERSQAKVDVDSLEELQAASPDAGPEEQLESLMQRRTLRSLIPSLPERERLIMALYYQEELTLKEIGAVLSVSESRVSQILNAVAMKLRSQVNPGP
jgi:RNA polymerase sigma factor for flagellar operon FliA